MVAGLDAHLLQMRAIADAGQHEQLRGVDGAAAQHHLAPGAQRLLHAALGIDHAGAAAIFQQEAACWGIGDDLQIGRAGFEIGGGGGAAQAIAGGDLIPAGALLLMAVEIGVFREAQLLGRGDEGGGDGVVVAHIGDAERAALAVQVIGATLIILGGAEMRQDIGEAPADAAQLPPMIVIGGLAADIDQAVDGGGAAHHPAARPIDLAAFQLWLAGGFQVPGEFGVIHGLGIADGDMQPGVGGPAAGLEQHHPRAWLFRQPGRDRASGRAGAHHDVICFQFHGVFSLRPALGRRGLRSTG